MTNDENTRVVFLKSLNQIALNFVLAYRLEFRREERHLDDPLCRWLDFRLRYIDPAPRKVVLSNKFPKRLPLAVGNGLKQFIEKLHAGIDVNSYQSKGLVKFNDFSGRKRAKRTDLLWADWGIQHFHITDSPLSPDKYFSVRKCSDGESWLLFCIVMTDVIGIIDIRKHGEQSLFSDQDLIRTIKKSWPEYMEQFRLNDIAAPDQGFTNDEIAHLRKSGINIPLCIEGGVYISPGMGITTASTSLKVTHKANQLLRWAQQLASWVNDENGPIQLEVKRLNIKKPQFELCVTPKGFAILEKKSNVAFTLSKNPDCEGYKYYIKMVDLVCPEWALPRLS